MARKEIPELDEVRRSIESYVKRVANLQDEKGKGVEILKLRDAIEDWLSFYESRGASVEPERTRLQNFDALLEKNAVLFLRIAGKEALERERTSIAPSQERFWWWLDEKVHRERKKRLRRTVATLGVVLGVLLMLYLFVFRLPPQEERYLNALTTAERFLEEENWEEVINQCLKALETFPDRPTPYVIAALAAEKLGREEEASRFLEKARPLYQSETDLLLEEANWYFRVGDLEKTKIFIARILQSDPENLTALNLLGAVYEAENNVVEALKVYQLVLDVAERKNEVTLIPMTKMKIGMLQLRLPLSLPEVPKDD
ncbi:MAG: tetratricopeptide repeat protein [Candidatus Caldatribacteriaceae bacterium]